MTADPPGAGGVLAGVRDLLGLDPAEIDALILDGVV